MTSEKMQALTAQERKAVLDACEAGRIAVDCGLSFAAGICMLCINDYHNKAVERNKTRYKLGDSKKWTRR